MTPEEDPEDTVTCGKGVLTHLRPRLTAAGLEPGDVLTEDWGALLEVSAQGERFCVCSGFRGEDWVITVTGRQGPRAPLRDSAPLRRLLTAVDAALRGLAGIADLSWHRADAWDRGDEDHGTVEPLAT